MRILSTAAGTLNKQIAMERDYGRPLSCLFCVASICAKEHNSFVVPAALPLSCQ